MFNAVVEPYDADAVRQSLINHGKAIMNTQSQITCDTGVDEHSHNASPSTSIITSSQENLGTNVPIQGVSGATYAPMDTTPMSAVDIALAQVTNSIASLVQALRDLQQPNQQANLVEAVDVALGNAEWFKEMVEEKAQDLVEEQDFEYEIGRAVELEMRNFDPNDYVDFDDLVCGAVADNIDDAVNSALDDRLETLLEEKLANAKITINF